MGINFVYYEQNGHVSSPDSSPGSSPISSPGTKLTIAECCFFGITGVGTLEIPSVTGDLP